jgi:hypothetical protein
MLRVREADELLTALETEAKQFVPGPDCDCWNRGGFTHGNGDMHLIDCSSKKTKGVE